MRALKIGDKVYLKEESIYTYKRIWKVIGITPEGVYHLERIVRGFTFLESARADDLVLKR